MGMRKRAARSAITIPQLRKHSNGQAYCKWRGVFFYFGAWEKPDLEKYRDFLRDEVDGDGLGGSQAAASVPPCPIALANALNENPDCTIAELVSAYLDAKILEYRDSDNLKKYQFRWKQAFEPLLRLYGVAPAAGFSARAFQVVRSHLAKVPGRSRGYVNDLANEVKLVVKWGVGQELCPPANLAAIREVGCIGIGKTALPEGEKVRPVPLEVVRQTLPFLHPPVRAMVELLMETVARPGEIAIIRRDLIDFQGPNKTWVFWPAKHKTMWKGKERFVTLNTTAQAILQPWLAHAKNNYCFVNDRTGKPYVSEQIRKAVERACIRAGIPVWFPYQIRHSGYTEIVKTDGEEAASLVAGNTIKMAGVYDHSRIERAAKVVQNRSIGSQ